MSYDVYIEVECGPQSTVTAFDTNMTSNVAPMWRGAGCDIADFDGRGALDLAASLHAALKVMREHPERFKAMNPQNGWGDYETTVGWLAGLEDACLTHSRGTIRVSR